MKITHSPFLLYFIIAVLIIQVFLLLTEDVFIDYRMTERAKTICESHGLKFHDYEGITKFYINRFDNAVCKTDCNSDYCEVKYFTFKK